MVFHAVSFGVERVLRTTLVWTSGPTLAQVEFGDVTRTGLGSTNLVQ